MRHSSAAVRWLCWRLVRVSSFCLIVASSCLIYSVRRSRKAACACLLRCLRSSEVAYICVTSDRRRRHPSQSLPKLTGLRPPLRFCGCAGVGSCDVSSPAGGPSCSGVDSTELGVRSAGAAGAGSILLTAAISSTAAVMLSPICRYPRPRAHCPPAG